MISAFARAALVLDESRYAGRAERAAEFILQNLRRDGRLLRSYHDGEANHNAYLDDYAFLIAALLDLYETTSDIRWLREAINLDHVVERFYEDSQNGGFFLTSSDHETLLTRAKPAYDGAEPSGNSVAVMNLLRLHELTSDDRYRQRAVRAFQALQPVLASSPDSLSEMLLALDFQLDTAKEIIIITPNARQEAGPLLARLRGTYVPNRILAVVPEKEKEKHETIVPLIENKRASQGRPTAYVCENRVCELPTSDPEVFARQIGRINRLPNSGSQ
jgi:uncharacterized protein YyaL (SSP411 family)